MAARNGSMITQTNMAGIREDYEDLKWMVSENKTPYGFY